MSLIADQAQVKYKNQVEENEASRHERNQSRRENGEHFGRGVVLAEIEPGSIAEELGLVIGDRLVQINSAPARDAIQLRMADSSESLSLTVVGQDGQPRTFDIEKDAFEPVGLHVDSELFDGVKRCANKCPFCFVDQLPPRVKSTFGTTEGFKNLRRTLYVRDDDYRLSFLHGHYITLTNLKDEDYARIIGEKLSPLCVSVHATDPATRVRMVGNKSAGAIMERLKYLLDNGITVNAQIVLCPEVNDGAILQKSIEDLMPLFPGVESVAIVPVGLTRWMPDDRGMRIVKPHEASAILEQLAPIQKLARKTLGTRFVYPSDEMYLLAGQPIPKTSYYDGFPQYANGVGTIRAFLDEVNRLKKRKIKESAQVLEAKLPPKITLVTGKLAAEALREMSQVINDKKLARSQVIEIEHKFWGGNVGCAGLIMGEEVRSQLQGVDCGEMLFLPPDAVDNQGRMLDDITLTQLSRELNTQVRADAHGPLELAEILKAA